MKTQGSVCGHSPVVLGAFKKQILQAQRARLQNDKQKVREGLPFQGAKPARIIPVHFRFRIVGVRVEPQYNHG